MKEAGIVAGHISIPEEAVLLPDEEMYLRDFAHNELSVRSAFRRLGNVQMRKSTFTAV